MKKPLIAIFAFVLIAAGDPATETEHKVKAGETLKGIANRAEVPLTVIAAANGLVEPYDVKVGQVLTIPRQRVHRVKAGESGTGIAEKYGVPFSLFAAANGLEPPYVVKAGQKLIIPSVVENTTPTMTSQPNRPFFRVPHDGKILLGYARRGDGGGHEGIDYAVNGGDMVRAASSGRVVFADKDSGRFGRIVVLDHGNGWRTRYGHLTRVTVKLGEQVKTGERIGIAGKAGEATRPELHFEIVRDGNPIDPRPLLADNPGQ